MSAQKSVKKKEVRPVIDLNEKRAARLETLGEGPRIKFGEYTFQCPPEIPFKVIEEFGHAERAEGTDRGFEAMLAMKEAMGSLLGDQLDNLMSENPSVDDLMNFISAVFSEYGVAEGESEASPAS